MNLNYVLIGAVLLAVIALIIYLIRRNYKDEKIVVPQMDESGVETEIHDEDKTWSEDLAL